MNTAFLGLGANLGNRRENLRAAVRMLAPSCRLVAASSLYESHAVVIEGAAPGPDYLNAVCAVETSLEPHELLGLAKSIEHALGRRPAERWASRPIDIDLLLYGDAVLDTPELTVPHPGISERAFVLVPLAEVAPDVRHPLLGRTISELAAEADREGLALVEAPAWAS